MSFIDELRTELDTRSLERDRLDATITELSKLLDLYEDNTGEAPEATVDEATAEAPKSKTKKKSKPKPRPEAITCPDCGQTGFNTPQAMGAHRRHEHPGSAAKPVAPLKAVPDTKPEPSSSQKPAGPAPSRDPLVKGKVLRCSCGHEEPNLNWLTIHTSGEHGRLPRVIERTPVPAEAAS
jgi:hypothetical protein